MGEQTIAYYSMTLNSFQYVIPQPTIFECYTKFKSENEEWILGDVEGRIYSLSIQDDEFLFNKLGEVSASLIILKVVFYPVNHGISRFINIVHWITFRGFTYRLPSTNSSPETNSHHKSCSNFRLPYSSPIPSTGWCNNYMFGRIRTRNLTRRPPRRWNRRLCCC